jgi:hypothetical protein
MPYVLIQWQLVHEYNRAPSQCCARDFIAGENGVQMQVVFRIERTRHGEEEWRGKTSVAKLLCGRR